MLVSLNSRLENNKSDEEEVRLQRAGCNEQIARQFAYRGTSLIRNSGRLGPYRRTMLRALWQSCGGGQFLVSKVPLYMEARLSCGHAKLSVAKSRARVGLETQPRVG